MVATPSFEFAVPDEATLGDRLVVGVADVGVAGLTAVDFLTGHLGMTQVGHVRTRDLPDITPFTEGEPRYPMRLYAHEGADLTVLTSEVFLPVWSADPFGTALFEWVASSGVSEVTVLFGAPFPHSEAEHAVFHVGTDDHRVRQSPDGEVPPLKGGFFDGVVGELVTCGMDDGTPPTGVLVTPSHYPGPDLEASIRLLDGFEALYDVAVDVTELRERSAEMKQHYEELANRMQALQAADEGQGRDYPEDRMYM